MKGLIASQTARLKYPKQMAQLGFEEDIEYIPVAGYGVDGYEDLHER